MIKTTGLLLIACVLTLCSCTAPAPPENAVAGLRGDWLGQAPPGMEPVLFAPGLISTGLYERDIVFTPDGNEAIFGILGRRHAALLVSRRVDGVWSEPEIAPFSRHPAIFDLEPHITPDGSRLLFLSNRPADGSEPKPGWHDQDIWAVDRTADGWGEPYNLGPPVNSEAPEYFPATTRDGTIYFTREVEADGVKRSLIHRCRMTDGTLQPAELLPAVVNAGDTQYNAFIDPDERYLIYGTSGLEGAIGFADYTIAFRNEDDSWTGPINMGERFNTPGNGVVSASLSPDGRFLFFASTRGVDDGEGGRSDERTWAQLQQRHNQPRNGNSDIYWVDAAVIEALRPE
jgi:hypothetical protein